jgi:hypothetical protein
MMSLIWRSLGGFTVAVALFPGDVQAQTVARSFEELQPILKVGQTVVVTDDSGRQTKGRLTDLSPSALVVSTPIKRTFAEGTVAEIRFSDSLSNGMLIGAAIGAGFATWDYLIDPSEPGNAAIFAVAIGMGTAIGAGIDALHKGGKVLYVSPQRMPGLEFSSVRAAPGFGIDLRIALSPHRAVAPHVRLDLRPFRSGLRAGTGVQWTF